MTPPRRHLLQTMALLAAAWPLAAEDLLASPSAAKATTTINLWDEYLRLNDLVAPQEVNAGTAAQSFGPAAPDAAASSAGEPVQTSAVVYGGRIRYGGDTPRSSALIAGAYLGVTVPALAVVETGAERLRIAYADGSCLLENDATLMVGRWYRGCTWYLHVGGHLIVDHDHGLGAGRTAIVGAFWVPHVRLRLGSDLYVSHIDVADPAVTAVQASPALSWRWHAGQDWFLAQDLGGSAIHLDADPGFDRRVLWSAQTRLRAGWGRWWGSIEGWAGERLYAVDAGGWAVYDLPALYRHGAALGLGRLLGGRSTITLSAGRDVFLPAGAADEAHADHILLILGSTF